MNMNRIFTLFTTSSLIVATLVSCSDANIRGRVTAEGKPVGGVQVSDGKQIVTTDGRGRYSMVSDKKDSVVFITTPSGYVASRAEGQVRPDFFALLTEGPDKCERHDFTLVKQDQSDYSVLFMTDVHFARYGKEVSEKGFTNDIFPVLSKLTQERLDAGKAVFCFQLGDFAHDAFWWENDYDERDAYDYLCKSNYQAPVFGVCGNHDNDASIIGEDTDFRCVWQFRHVWGPDRYAMNIGNDHWIFLDDIVYINNKAEKIKQKNILGDRSYEGTLRQEQLDWIREDLKGVPAGTHIYICLHCPIFNTHRIDESLPAEVIDQLDEIMAAYPKVTIYSGHAHMMHFPSTGKYTRFEQFVLPATSGDMWYNASKGMISMSGDGCEAGIFTADNYGSGTPTYEYNTLKFGPKAMRVYDMNEVGKYYRANKDVMEMVHNFGQYRHDFTSRAFRNMVLVDYYMHRPGETLHLIENGKELPVKQDKIEDPTYNVTHFLDEAGGKFKKGIRNYRYPHMFTAQAETATSPILIRVTDADGKVVREQELVRPKPFNPDGE